MKLFRILVFLTISINLVGCGVLNLLRTSKVKERELVSAPINSKEGQDYIGALICGLNYAHANRQVLTHLVRQSIKKVFQKAKIETFYEISHNSAKKEGHCNPLIIIKYKKKKGELIPFKDKFRQVA